VRLQNAAYPGSIRSVALPGLGARTGRVPAEDCAEYMVAAYRLFLDGELDAEQQAASASGGMWDRMLGFGSGLWRRFS
jgi:O-acetyl-ADP-ribose deacetylase (regulator of RNase III)